MDDKWVVRYGTAVLWLGVVQIFTAVVHAPIVILVLNLDDDELSILPERPEMLWSSFKGEWWQV